MHIEVKRMVSSHFKIWNEINHFPVGISNAVMLFDGNRLNSIDEIPALSIILRKALVRPYSKPPFSRLSFNLAHQISKFFISFLVGKKE